MKRKTRIFHRKPKGAHYLTTEVASLRPGKSAKRGAVRISNTSPGRYKVTLNHETVAMSRDPRRAVRDAVRAARVSSGRYRQRHEGITSGGYAKGHGVVRVAAHTRNGRQVSGYTRSR